MPALSAFRQVMTRLVPFADSVWEAHSILVLSSAFTVTDGVPVTGSLKATKNVLPSLNSALSINGFLVSTVTVHGCEVT